MFSIIIPLYNKEKYIVKAVNSVLNQTYKNFELIIINDGSTDNSLVQVLTFTDKRIKIYSQKNAGVSSARNVGVSLAEYELIAFLDADDWWHNNFLTEIYSLVSGCSDAALFGSSYFIVKNGQKKKHS